MFGIFTILTTIGDYESLDIHWIEGINKEDIEKNIVEAMEGWYEDADIVNKGTIKASYTLEYNYTIQSSKVESVKYFDERYDMIVDLLVMTSSK